jgi:hypothetical protein
MGYRNFFPIKKLTKGWSSPFGDVHLPHRKQEDALLIVPDVSWDLLATGTAFIVKDCTAGKQCFHYELESEQLKVSLVKGALTPLIGAGEKVFLTPRWDECFIIPL